MPALRGGASLPEEKNQVTVLEPHRWSSSDKSGGNHTGTRRRRYINEFIEDLHDSWRVYGRPVLMTAALTDPVAYLRVAASLIPREIDITVTTQTAERLSDDDLAGYLEGPDSADPAQAPESEETI